MNPGAVRDRMIGAPRSVRSTSMIMARTRSPLRRFSFGIISLRRRRPSTRPLSTMMSPLSRRLTVPTKILSPRDMKSLSSMLALGVADLLQDHLLGGLRADAADRHRLDRLLDVVVDLDVGDLLLAPRTAAPRRRDSAGRPRRARPASGGRSRSRRCRGRPRRGCRPRRRTASWWPEASAASTAPKTTSRSTFFSREMASTSINISRFIVADLRLPGTARRGRLPARVRAVTGRPLKSTTGTRRASRTSSSQNRDRSASRRARAAVPSWPPGAIAGSAPAVAVARGASTPCELLAALERQLQRQRDRRARRSARSRPRVFSGRSSPGDDTSSRCVGERLRPRARTAAGA